MFNDIHDRKLSFIEILNCAFDIYVKNFKYMLFIAAIVFIPYQIVIFFVPLPNLSVQELQNMVLTGDISALIIPFYAILGVNIVFMPLSIAGAAYVSKQFIGSKSCTLPGILDVSIVKIGKHILTNLLYYIAVLCGSFFLVIPGIILAISFYFASYVVAVSDKWGVGALLESRKIIKGQWLSLLMFSIGVYAFSYAFAQVFSVAEGIFGSLVVMAAGKSMLASSITYFICSIIRDICNLFFSVMGSVWFFNRQYVQKYEEL